MTKLLDIIEYGFIGALLPQCEKTNANFVIKFLLLMISTEIHASSLY